MSLIVQKYGGTSVADAGRIQNVAQRVASRHRAGDRLVVVVSAMGDTTDRLVELARRVSEEPEARELDHDRRWRSISLAVSNSRLPSSGF